MLKRPGQENADDRPAREDEMTAAPGTAPNLPDQRPISFIGWSVAIGLGLALWALILAAFGIIRF